MNKEVITIDVDALKEDMKSDCLGAFLGGGFGGALIESFDIDVETTEKLLEEAKSRGIDLRKYQV